MTLKFQLTYIVKKLFLFDYTAKIIKTYINFLTTSKKPSDINELGKKMC